MSKKTYENHSSTCYFSSNAVRVDAPDGDRAVGTDTRGARPDNIDDLAVTDSY